MKVFTRPPEAAVRRLLADAELPTGDLDARLLEHFLGCGGSARLTGVVGLEPLGEVGLLRSLAVAPGLRGTGLGAGLLAHAERRAQLLGVRTLYLLTTTAAPFFAARGYRQVAREEAPPALRRTREFAELCPASAAFMARRLDARVHRLATARLLLRPLAARHTEALQRAAGAHDVADTMISLAHPYPPGAAARQVAARRADWRAGRAFCFALERAPVGEFVGLAELREVEPEHAQAELSFWVATPAQGRGYAPEAVAALVGYGFGALGLNRLYACHMTRNAASGRVLARCGFRREGLLRQRVRKWGRFEDVVLQALLREEYCAG